MDAERARREMPARWAGFLPRYDRSHREASTQGGRLGNKDIGRRFTGDREQPADAPFKAARNNSSATRAEARREAFRRRSSRRR